MAKVTIAVEGCGHGELDKIYSTLQYLEQREGKKIDLVLCCGDFQAVRNLDDLETMACPPKYRSMQSFYKYYSGEKVAPYPTIFIGGNHEAAAHLWELYYGGWAAPNIYFMGFAGAVRFGGLRIAGLSGIFKPGDYKRGHHERAPLTDSSMRSIYHIRDFEVFRLMQLQTPVDVFLSHDWPSRITEHGNRNALLSKKPFLRQDIESGQLGSPPAQSLLEGLKPAYWFSAHLHTKFAALVPHADGSATRFLSLDKCLPGRDFLQVFELDAKGPLKLQHDEEWLAVLRSTAALTNLRFQHAPLPGMGALRSGPKPADVDFVRSALAARGSADIPDNFTPTAVPFDPKSPPTRRAQVPAAHVRNPQTEALLELIGVRYNLDHAEASEAGPGPGPGSRGAAAAAGQRFAGRGPAPPAAPRAAAVPNPEEIELDLDDLDDDDGGGGGERPAGQEAEDGGVADDTVDDGDEAGAEGDGGAGGGEGEVDPMFRPFKL